MGTVVAASAVVADQDAVTEEELGQRSTGCYRLVAASAVVADQDAVGVDGRHHAVMLEEVAVELGQTILER